LLHTLPHGFARIRFFGFLAGPRRSKMLQLARQLLEVEHELDVPVSTPVQAAFQCLVCATRSGGVRLITVPISLREANVFMEASPADSRGGDRG